VIGGYVPKAPQLPVSAAANFQRFGGLGGGVGTGAQGGGGVGNGGGNFGGGQVGAGGGGSFSSLRGGQGLVPEGTQRLMYDPATNSLLFQGTARALNDLYALLATFDKAPQQVQVKFEFVTVTRELHTALGIDWTYERGGVFFGVNPGTFARTQDNVFFNWASGNVSSRLRATLTGSEGNSVFSPMVRTLNNQLGSVQFVTTITIFQSQVSQGAGGNVTSVIATPRQIPTQVQVRPRVNGDGTITMAVNPQISTLGALRRGPDGTEVPDTISQFAQVVATIKNGESIAIGGLTNKTQSSSYARIPLLSDLPIIGQLFRTRHRDDNSSELIIFITPTLVAADEAGLVPGGG
jgi:general secretion pathway protein D